MIGIRQSKSHASRVRLTHSKLVTLSRVLKRISRISANVEYDNMADSTESETEAESETNDENEVQTSLRFQIEIRFQRKTWT